MFHHAYVCIQFLYSLPSQFVQIFMKSQCNFQTISQDFFSCHILHGKSCENAGGYKLRPDFRLPLTQACTNFIRVSLIWKILEFHKPLFRFRFLWKIEGNKKYKNVPLTPPNVGTILDFLP